MPEVLAILPAVTLLGVGLACIVAARLVGASPIVFFIAAGVAIGPHALGLAPLNATTGLLAQLGVVFLLFEIGLGFSTKTLRESGKDLVVLGPLQMLACGAGFGAAALAFGASWPLAILVGLGAGISATAVVTATLKARNLTTCPLGRSATSVLVFQDIAGIFLLIFAASLGDGAGALGPALAVAGLNAALAAGAALLIGRYGARPALGFLARAGGSDVFTAAALFLVLATAAATGALGLSLTLGAFLAGVIVAETPYRALVKTEAKPFGALLLGFFFITVGMGLDWRTLVAQAPLILAAVAALMAGKTVLTFLAALASGWSRPGATQLSFLTAQGSEFGLVLLALPAVAGALGADIAGALVAASALSLALTPAWTGLGLTLARRQAAGRAKPAAPQAGGQDRPILLFAMTPAGRLALDGLKRFNVPVVAIESDPRRFMTALADGYDVGFGDPSDLRLMNAVGAVNARALALGQSRYAISKEVTPFVNETYPDLERFVVVDSQAEAEQHRALGMHPVLNRSSPEGADFAAALLHFAGVDDEAIMTWIDEIAEAHGQQLVSGASAA